MGIRTQAAADAKAILNDKENGLGWDIILFDPAAPTVEIPFVGFSNDIALLIDPDTDEFISGRLASVAISLTDVYAADLSEIPRAIADTSARPWVVQVIDLSGDTHRFKVAKSMPDRGINLLVLYLEQYV